MLPNDADFLSELLTEGARAGGVVTIPPRDYYLSGEQPVWLSSGTTVFAYGARFHWPEVMGDRARGVMFAGENLRDFSWFGGHFEGRCFDNRREVNTWEPNACTRAILVTTGSGGVTANLTFRDISSQGVGGAVVTVVGVGVSGSESETATFAENVTVENCTLLESGKFMWDYGLLWQILIWPEDYSAQEIKMAERYFRNDLVVGDIVLRDGDTRVQFANRPPASVVTGQSQVCFYGDVLPSNIQRGQRYFVANATADGIEIRNSPAGPSLGFEGSGGVGVKLISNVFEANVELYAPFGSGPGKGAFDLVCCKNVRVAGCKISALGDSMHIHRGHNVVFSGNHILGSRMGAFFLSEYCKNSTIIGNVVDGTNGSRVMSIERSNEDVVVTGNTFRNGGRGSWINQPKNLVMQGNIFINNTTKCEADPKRGRRSFLEPGYEQYAEIYFTTYAAGATYGPVIFRDNIVETGPSAAATMRFMSGARQVLVRDNIFRGAVGCIQVAEDAEVEVKDNVGATLERKANNVSF